MKAGFTAKILKDFDESKFRDLIRRFDTGNKAVNVGFPAGEPHKPKEGEKPEPYTVAQIAAVHEFGSPEHGIPERSFLRAAINENRQKYFALNRDSLRKVMAGDITMEVALGKLGAMAQGDVQLKIVRGPFQALSPLTIARKGSSKPLIDSGQMRQSVQWVLANDRDE